jgi:oligopeptide transport system permease protein
MWSYVLRRLLATIPTLLAVITVSYLLLHGAGRALSTRKSRCPPPCWPTCRPSTTSTCRCGSNTCCTCNNLLQGDLGASFRYADWSVNELVAKALPVSLAIGGIAMLISLLVGVFLGIVAALRQNSAIDFAVMLLANIGQRVSLVRDRPGDGPGVRALAQAGCRPAAGTTSTGATW